MSSTSTRARGFERPFIYFGAIVGALVLVVAGILLVRYLSEPDTLPDKVAALILEGSPGHSCLNGEVSHERVRVAERPDLYPDLIPSARSAVILACDNGGAVSVVVEFDSPAALERAFARSRPGGGSFNRNGYLISFARSSAWCVVGTGAFDGSSLDHRRDLTRFCRRLHGTVRPAAGTR